MRFFFNYKKYMFTFDNIIRATRCIATSLDQSKDELQFSVKENISIIHGLKMCIIARTLKAL